MRKVLTLTAACLLAGSLALAQDTTPSQSPSSSSQQQSTTSSTPSDQSQSSGTSITGCLNGSDGNFTLTDQSGTTYQLKGATSDLKQHVGHQVQLSGTTTGADTTSSASASSSGQTQSSSSSSKSFTVTNVKHMADTCSASPSSQLGSGVSGSQNAATDS